MFSDCHPPKKKYYINCDGRWLDPRTEVDKAACFLTNRKRKSHHGWTLNSKIDYLNNVLWTITSCFLLCSDNRPSSWKDSLSKTSSSAHNVLAVEDEIQGLTQMAVKRLRSIEQKVDTYIYIYLPKKMIIILNSAWLGWESAVFCFWSTHLFPTLSQPQAQL